MDNQGSQEFAARILADHGPALLLYAQQLCDCPEDVVQEALLRLVAENPSPQPVLPWLYRVVRHRALNARRAAVRRARHESRAAEGAASWFESSAEQQLSGTEATRALRDLPDDQRETIVARIWGGLAFQEIAELTGCSVSTAHRRYAAGLLALRSRLDTASSPSQFKSSS